MTLRLHRFTLLLLMTIGFAACKSTTTIRIESDPSHLASISSQSTFAWIPGAGERHGKSRIYDIDGLDDLLKSAVAAQLKSHGYRETTYQDADLKLSFQVGLVDVLIDTQVGDPMERSAAWERRIESHDLRREFEKGSFYLEVMDSSERTLLWRGGVSAIVDAKQPLKKRQQFIYDKMAEFMLEFPSKS